jgi:hypothetical protein
VGGRVAERSTNVSFDFRRHTEISESYWRMDARRIRWIRPDAEALIHGRRLTSDVLGDEGEALLKWLSYAGHYEAELHDER